MEVVLLKRIKALFPQGGVIRLSLPLRGDQEGWLISKFGYDI
jgi:hypothetical protein